MRNGFSGPIYTSSATIDLCLAMLADSAYLQEKDAEFVNHRRQFRKSIGRDDREAVPLYTHVDAEHTTREYGVEAVQPAPGDSFELK